VCKWLFEVGAAADITKASNSGFTPMCVACEKGHLSVCKWLFEVGAAADITKAINGGFTPMYIACDKGHLSVCKWLFKEGAAADIRKANNNGETPMLMACKQMNLHPQQFSERHFSMCKWLVFNGALNRPSSAQGGNENDTGHVERDIVAGSTVPGWFIRRPTASRQLVRGPPSAGGQITLLAWARGVVATHRTFLHVVLRGSVILPDSQHQASPDQRCLLPRLPRVVLERVGAMLDVEMGRRLRNAREFADALEALGVEVE